MIDMFFALATKITFVIERNGAGCVPVFVISFPEMESTYKVGNSRIRSEDFEFGFETISNNCLVETAARVLE